MIRLFLFSLVLIGAVIDPTRVSKINALKKEAKAAYNNGDYKTAVAKYKELNEKYGVNEDEVQLNLANGYLLSKDTANAMTTFQPLTNSTNKEIASKAHQQLGIIASQQKKYDQALSDFKQAIRTNPSNESARYDYELLKKMIEENKKKQEQKDQNKDQQKQDQKDKKDQQQNKDQNKDQKDQKNKDDKKNDQKNKDEQKKDQEKKDQDKKDQEDKNKQDQKKDEQKEKDQQQQDQQKEAEKKDKQDLKDQNFDQNKIPQVSKQKAEMILEAMKNQEKQYLQQQKRKATKSRDRNKPDW